MKKLAARSACAPDLDLPPLVDLRPYLLRGRALTSCSAARASRLADGFEALMGELSIKRDI
jgi:hypothetical protein